jgi:glycosyltransferase involved in cell wall biosynthesis
VNDPARLLLAAQPLHSGVAHHLISLVEALPAGRFTVDLACPRESLMWSELAGRPGLQLHRIRRHRRPAPADALSGFTLLQLVRRADVVHAHSAKAGFLARVAAAATGRRGRCLFTPHGWSFWAVTGPEQKLYLELERAAARWCRTIVTLSGAERDAGIGAGVGRAEQYRVIPNGVELRKFAQEPQPVAGRVLMVGRLARPKRPELAIRAFVSVRRAVPRAELHIVGDGALQSEAEQLVRGLQLSDAVRFLGHREDIAELLAAASCALLVSDYEGCPLAVVEAMAAGVPVVAMDAGGVAELVEHGRTGLITPTHDVDALAAALIDVLTHSEAARAMGAAGREVARQRLSIERMVESTVELYEEALAANA